MIFWDGFIGVVAGKDAGATERPVLMRCEKNGGL